MTLNGADIQFNRAFTTECDGQYVFTLVPAGTYVLKIEKPGFKPYERRGIVLGLAESANQNVTLEVGAVTEKVHSVLCSAVMCHCSPPTYYCDFMIEQCAHPIFSADFHEKCRFDFIPAWSAVHGRKRPKAWVRKISHEKASAVPAVDVRTRRRGTTGSLRTHAVRFAHPV